MKADSVHLADHRDEDTAVRLIFEGTAAETGERFFQALVTNLARALNVSGAWVTEYHPASKQLRALSFWFDPNYILDYQYNVGGTPCEVVVEEKRLVHYPDDITVLFPGDRDLKRFGAVSYLGVPLSDVDGRVLGHLAVMDAKPMPLKPRIESLLRIFAARAAAELQRLRVETDLREREEKLSRLVNSAMDAVIELDSNLAVTHANTSAGTIFRCEVKDLVGRDFRQLLAPSSAGKLEQLRRDLEKRGSRRKHMWIPGGLQAISVPGDTFPAEASLSLYQVRQQSFSMLILRNVHDQLEAEKKIESLTDESNYLKEEIEQLHNFHEIIGRNPALTEVLSQISQAARTDATVLIFGETGTGKELFARALHAASNRTDKPLVKVNCAAIPPSLMESEFFGHEKGAFTGATQRRIGRFALAHRGTIFLDEIGELPLDLQAKLLRVLQEGEFEPVGSSQTQKVDVRIIAATNRNLEQAIGEGKFREDLYYRLNVFPIAVPPLRERGNDITLLAEGFARRYAQKIGRRAPALSSQCRRRLHAYHWPGNIRELENIIERAVILSRDDFLHLDAVLSQPSDSSSRTPTPTPGEELDRILTAKELREFERANLLRALDASSWQVSGASGAAKRLGMAPSTLNSRLKALGIDPSRRRPQ